MNDPHFASLLESSTTSRGRNLGHAGASEVAFDLDVGEIRYPLPPRLRADISRITAEQDRLWYSNPLGEPELRRAYLARLPLAERIGPDSLLVTSGGKEAAFLAVRYLMSRGTVSAVLVPSPCWEPYRWWVRAAGAQILSYDPAAVASNPNLLRRLLLDCDPRPGLLVVNYPHNPTGVEVTRAVMDEIVAIATEFGIDLVSDEVYRIFGRTQVSAATAPAFDPHRHLIVDSVSKTLTVAGLRVGFLLASPRIVADLAAYRAAYAGSTSALTQRIATELLSSAATEDWLSQVRVSVTDTRTATAAALTSLGVEVVSQGALYLWCRIPATMAASPGPADDPAARVRPGAGMGAPDHVRVCTARAGLDPHAAAAAVVQTLRSGR